MAWFVGNCDTKSKRELYVKELQKYIDVDIYGKCGSLKCPDNPKVYDPRMNKECYDMLEQNYKFYLSFENIFCKDYVTEKLFNILPLQVIGENVTLMLNRMLKNQGVSNHFGGSLNLISRQSHLE